MIFYLPSNFNIMHVFSNLKRLTTTPTRLIIMVSIFIILTGNFTFFDKLTDIYPWNYENIGFILSLGIFLSSLLVLITAFFNLLLPVRVVVSLMLLMSAAIGYYLDNLGVVIDIEMIRNIIETNISEASDLITVNLMLRFIILGLLPVFIIWYMPINESNKLRELRYTLQLATASFAIIFISAFPFSDHYASFFREHKPIRYYINPILALHSAGKYIKEITKSTTKHKIKILTNNPTIDVHSKKNELIIFVVGETARADHFSLDGYSRKTNPYLSSKQGVISFTEISSCGTSTAISVPCMFSYYKHDDFDSDVARNTENVLDILQRAGVSILWRDNNSSSKGVASRIEYEDFKSNNLNTICDPECRDIGMLVGLQAYINKQQGDILIVLHQMGSHGPAYYKRYPDNFNKFQPACNTLELSSCTKEEITNAYDNTILYTDYFLSEVINFLKKNTPKYETTMLYVSDHGESLGESGIYLHGMPYIFAPKSQTNVPIIAWVSETSDVDFEKTIEFNDSPNSHDVLFATLLNAFEVRSDLDISDVKPLLYFKDEAY
ncbi:MAG: phosphoethanolamine--lipid A transferase [Woeseiaceae bacterium]